MIQTSVTKNSKWLSSMPSKLKRTRRPVTPSEPSWAAAWTAVVLTSGASPVNTAMYVVCGHCLLLILLLWVC